VSVTTAAKHQRTPEDVRGRCDPAAYPPPGGANGWTESSVSAILRNPKYTGYMVYGRTRKDPATKKSRPVPADQWVWSPEPTHDALTSLATWQAAQGIGAERGNVRDSEKPTIQPGSRYMLRSRIRHQACQRRMYGTRRPTSAKATPGAEYTYYHCPYNPSNPRHVAALLADPRVEASQATPQPASPAPTPDLAQSPISTGTARDHERARARLAVRPVDRGAAVRRTVRLREGQAHRSDRRARLAGPGAFCRADHAIRISAGTRLR
jgi:Recombinase